MKIKYTFIRPSTTLWSFLISIDLKYMLDLILSFLTAFLFWSYNLGGNNKGEI